MPPLGVVVYKSARYFDAKVIFTNRMLRLIALFLSIALLLSLSCYIWISLTSVLPLIILFSLPLMLLSNTIITPLEKRNNQKYIVSAKAKLSKPDLIKIGITGSYGKTSVKEILKVILAKKYKVAVTAGNFNTPLGIAKTVNAMDSGCEVFIAEMGARRSGDIEELVSFVKPDIGVLTGIAEQHTETFINLQSIIKEKRKLIDYTKTAVINAENEIIRDNCADSNFIKIRFEDGGDLNIRNAYCDKRGGRFSLEFGGEVLTLSTQLLGRHNILNIALAVAVALKLNVSSQLIQAAVEELEPLPHRQQKILTEKGITIIDDSYNINSEGVRAALDTLDMFGGRKIVAVSGFVEMGDKEKEYNYLLGEWISEVADIIIVLDDKFKNDIISGAL
ncbi:MAG: UDP-N-acetylmuramoyl-tripeptide--D-alanyl-D-alanine ligase, partial [Clostridia bacterium]|nr:UDP-N-acetylmuramoyl-tripeptide--D-alanyl-D-alanine ligase [Clostridia bacterium]